MITEFVLFIVGFAVIWLVLKNILDSENRKMMMRIQKRVYEIDERKNSGNNSYSRNANNNNYNNNDIYSDDDFKSLDKIVKNMIRGNDKYSTHSDS